MRMATHIGRPDGLGDLTPNELNGYHDRRLGAAPSMGLLSSSRFDGALRCVG
jgi:hypothetical protein